MHYPSEANDFQAPHAALLGDSYLKLLHRPLIGGECGSKAFARALFEAPFAVVSHDTEADPIFNYANRKAQELFGMDWQEFTRTPSRYSAEPVNREERQRLLDQVDRHGFIDHYQGVRISKQGRRFMIRNAVVWNLSDDDGLYRGQAACFAEWLYL
nr:MEKHLA domain-containing protein [Methylomarinum sp. Ch1-1]MDP4521652.1 MEKHLA domain-containing protein [Methylomarinum sp. Ch1-1]